MKDMMGNTLAAGDYFVYAAIRYRSVGIRAGRVLEDGKLRIVARWGSSWDPIRGRPDFNQLVKVEPQNVSAELKEILA